jgi:histone-lysine N-methyltransferase SETMAR
VGIGYGTCQQVITKELGMHHVTTHHNNAPFHTSILTQQFLAKYKMTVIPHPPYSPDLTLCDFFLFQKIKLKQKGRWFDTID